MFSVIGPVIYKKCDRGGHEQSMCYLFYRTKLNMAQNKLYGKCVLPGSMCGVLSAVFSVLICERVLGIEAL